MTSQDVTSNPQKLVLRNARVEFQPQDKWLTVDKATNAMLEHASVVKVVNRIGFLAGLNEFDVTVLRVRVFDGSEHPAAKADHVLDWRW